MAPTGMKLLPAVLFVLILVIVNLPCRAQMQSNEPLTGTALGRNQLPIFPGAEGFGTDTRAGRGGQIIKVTNLRASGAGSLKEALKKPGPRLIVFEVGGVIDWTGEGPEVTITEPYVTIAGQTAPPPGISIKGSGIRIVTHDVLIQHIRIRVGNDGYEGIRDGIMILGDADRVVIDHVSIAWATNEGFVTWKSPRNITLRNSIISENHFGERHGVLLGDLSQNISLIGNLISENPDRNPLIKGGASVVLINNLVNNPGSGNPCIITDDYNHGPSKLSLIGNLFRQGPQTKTNYGSALVSANNTAKPGTQIYQDDNVYLDRKGVSLTLYSSDAIKYQVATSPLSLAGISIKPGHDVLARVVAHAGARPVERDLVDQRAIAHLLHKTGQHPDTPADGSELSSCKEVRRPLVIPDDPHGDENGNGYTNIEEMLHRMAAEVEGRQ